MGPNRPAPGPAKPAAASGAAPAGRRPGPSRGYGWVPAAPALDPPEAVPVEAGVVTVPLPE